MFRYHSTLNAVDLSHPRTRSVFADGTTKALVVPVWAAMDDQQVDSRVDGFEAGAWIETSRKVSATTTVVAGTPVLTTTELSATDAFVGRHSGLPVIMLPGAALTPSQQHCVVDGLKTGAANSTGGAVLGALIGWCVAGLPGAATGAMWGGGGGAMTSVPQTIATHKSNSFRRACARGNEVLLDARLNGLSVQVLNSFSLLCGSVSNAEERDLVRQIVEAFEAEFGVRPCAGLRAQYRLLS